MRFNPIPKKELFAFGPVTNIENFRRFLDDFNLVGVKWCGPSSLSGSYLLRLLEKGSSQRARGRGPKSYGPNDNNAHQLGAFREHLFDHGAMWKTKDGKFFFTGMPYGAKEEIMRSFEQLKENFQYPETIQLKFLDDKYRYRTNGDYMVMVYDSSIFDFK